MFHIIRKRKWYIKINQRARSLKPIVTTHSEGGRGRDPSLLLASLKNLLSSISVLHDLWPYWPLSSWNLLLSSAFRALSSLSSFPSSLIYLKPRPQVWVWCCNKMRHLGVLGGKQGNLHEGVMSKFVVRGFTMVIKMMTHLLESDRLCDYFDRYGRSDTEGWGFETLAASTSVRRSPFFRSPEPQRGRWTSLRIDTLLQGAQTNHEMVVILSH